MARDLEDYLTYLQPDPEKCDEDGYVNCVLGQKQAFFIFDSWDSECAKTHGCTVAFDDLSYFEKTRVSYRFAANTEEMAAAFNNLKSEISCDFAKSTLKNWENIAKVVDDSLSEFIRIFEKWGCDPKCLNALTYQNIYTDIQKCGCPEPISIKLNEHKFDYSPDKLKIGTVASSDSDSDDEAPPAKALKDI